MKTSELSRTDYNPFYHTYIEVLGEVDLLDMMQKQLGNFPEFIKSIPESLLHTAYAEGKWTIAEVLLHVIDAERVFQYRAFRIGRGDQTPLPGFDQDAYVPRSRAGTRDKNSLISEYESVRMASLSLFRNLDESQIKQYGTVSNARISVAALGFIICGHQKHHRNIIRQRYLPQS